MNDEDSYVCLRCGQVAEHPGCESCEVVPRAIFYLPGGGAVELGALAPGEVAPPGALVITWSTGGIPAIQFSHPSN